MTRSFMTKVLDNFNRSMLFFIYGFVLFLMLQMPTYAQQGSYSTMAQRILDNNGTATEPGELDVFKFSINDILNSSGNTVENAYGEPTIFGLTDYGSEFTLANDLDSSFSIEIPAFVIDDLAETDAGEYFPVIKNGDNDEEDGTYVNTYADNALGTQVTEYFNSEAPDKIETIYDYGTMEIEYLSDNGIDVKDHIYEDGSVYKTFFQDDETNILASTNIGADGSTSRYFSDPDSNYSYSTSNNVDGSIYTSFHDGTNTNYSQTVNNNNELISSYYYDNGISLTEASSDDGTSQTTFSNFDNDGSGNFRTIVENKNAANSVTNLQYTDQDNTTPIEFTLDSVTDTGVVKTQTFKSNSVDSDIVKTITGGDIKIVYGGVNVFEYLDENKNSLIDQAPDVITDGESVITEGITTVTEANNAINPNSLAIDFKELYNSENGLAITPEMGYVRLSSGDGNQYINLSNGDIVEFFVRPTDTFYANHNSEDLFFIDRPVPESPIIAETDSSNAEYGSADSTSSETGINIYVGPGEQAVTLPSGEIKIYVTSVYVQAPASKFLPSQVVMPVQDDGDYNYDIEPAAAETFPGEVEVVAIPQEEARVISTKVKQIKKAKETPSNPKHNEDDPPALDPGIEAMIKLNILLNDVQKAPAILLSETKKKIQKDFRNISDELINLIFNMAESDEKFDIIRDPKTFLEKEFSKVSNPQNLNEILNRDLSQKELVKIYNILQYRFSSELTEFVFDTLENQKVEFSKSITSRDQIVEQLQLQNDLLPLLSLLGAENKGQSLSSLLRDPLIDKPDSAKALFESGQSKKILGKMKNMAEAINLINSGPRVIRTGEDFLNNDIPVIEVNVGVGENIAAALEEKLAKDKRLNREFQPRSQSSKLEKFSFDIPPQNDTLTPSASPPLLADAPNITDQEIQLVSETTEATNNILDETVAKMLKELGEDMPDDNTFQLVAGTNNLSPLERQEPETSETVVFSNALSTVKRLQEIEDIRAIFQILGLGS
ncbi:hypothetical protein OA871_03045 [Paracoccaceae bacterium]|nr:hypothetical protein [Paracoccaceae bacterium]